MTSLDPQASYDLKKLMREHADEQYGTLLDTRLEVAEQLWQDLQFWKRKLLFYGTIQELKAKPDSSAKKSTYH